MPNVLSGPLPDYVSADDYHDGLQQIRVALGQCGYGIGLTNVKYSKSKKHLIPGVNGEPPQKKLSAVILQCARSKKYRKDSKGIRISTTRMTQCPWRGKMTRNDGGGWKVKVLCNEHNHPINDKLNDDFKLPRARSDKSPEKIDTFTPPGSPWEAPVTSYTNQTPTMRQTPSNRTPLLMQQRAPMQSRALIAQIIHSANPTRWTKDGIKRIYLSPNQRAVSSTRYPVTLDTAAFVVYNEAFDHILGEEPELQMVYQEDFPFAHRGGVYFPHNDFVFVTSNQFIPEGHHSKTIVISKLSRKSDGSWSRHEVPNDVIMASGAINYDDGLLVCAQGDLMNQGGLVHMEGDFPYRTRTLLNNYFGRPFNSIKELTVPSDGSIWFTDPIYGHEQGIRPAPQLPNQVYRFDPETGDVRVMADGFGRPCGICFSPYERICYISDTDFIHGNGEVDLSKPATIYAFDVEERRQTKWLLNRRVFAMANVGVPDGIKCDMAGNVYAACADGLSVWNSGGMFLGKVIIPAGVASFCFGKRGEIFLLNGKRFWVLKISDIVKGALLERMGIDVDPLDSE